MIRALLTLLAAPLLHAAPVTVNYGAQSSGAGVGKAGTELPAGCLVMVGHFTLPTSQILAKAADHFTLLDHFEVFATGRVGTFNGTPQGVAGGFSGSVNVESTQHSGKRVAIWVLDAPGFATATSHLIFSDPAWTIPAGFGSLSCQTNDPDLATAADAILIATRNPAVTSPTLGGTLNQSQPLSHPDETDHDGDGRPAIVEHATGTNPAVADAGPLQIIPGTLTLTRRPAASGTATIFQSALYSYRLERSQDLAGWGTFDADVQSASTAPHPTDPTLEKLFMVFPAPTSGRDFFRIAVTRR